MLFFFDECSSRFDKIQIFLAATFHTNPQYHVSLQDVDDDDDDNQCSVVVALMQKNRRLLKKCGVGMLTIGYEIYKVSRS